MHADLIISNIGQLVTCACGRRPKRGSAMRDIGLIENGGVAIADGMIVGVDTSENIRGRFNGVDELDAEGRVVCPGFVDPHTHIVFAGDRLHEFELKIKGADYLDILAAGGGILSTVDATRAASFEELLTLGLQRLDKMLACGTTTAEIKTGYGLDTGTELKMLRVIEELHEQHSVDIVPTFLAAHAIPPEFKDRSDDYVSHVCSEMLPRAWDWYERSRFNRRVPFFVDVFCEKNAFQVQQARRIFETAREMGFGIKAHVDEFSNLGGSRMSMELEATTVDHLDAISDDEIKLLAGSNTLGVLTPTVNFNFGGAHFANARKLIDEGCAVALSTDYNPGSAPCPSQPMAMAIATRYQKITPAEAFNASTINAAFAVGLSSTVGSIEIGKAADLILLDVCDYRALVYEFGGDQIRHVFKAGKIVTS